MAEAEAEVQAEAAGGTAAEGPVVLFDAACVLCDRSVRFIAAREREGAAVPLQFAALGSPAGRRLLARHGLAEDPPDSVVLVEAGRAWVRSDAVLRIAGHLRAPWRWAAAGRVVPRPLRDGLYRLVAAVRYRLFGRKSAEACGLPPAGLAARVPPGGLEAAQPPRPSAGT